MRGEVFVECVSAYTFHYTIATFGTIEKVSPPLRKYCDGLFWVSSKDASDCEENVWNNLPINNSFLGT